MILNIDEKCLHIESDTVVEILAKIKKLGCVQEIAKAKWLRNYSLSHHNYRLSTVATFSRPNRIGQASSLLWERAVMPD